MDTEGKGDEAALRSRRGAGVLRGKDVAAKLLPKVEFLKAGTALTQERRKTPATGSHQVRTGCICKYDEAILTARSGRTG